MAGFPHGKFWPLLGGILVAVGVIGEFWFTGQISGTETTLRGNSRQIEAALNAEAQNASERAGKLENDNAQLRKDAEAERLDRISAERSLAGQMKEAQTDLLNATTTERNEEQTLVNVAGCTAPRVIPTWSLSASGKTSIDPLQPFKGYNVEVDFLPDAEARRAALSLANSLKYAGWNITKLAMVDGIADGVEVQPFRAPDNLGFHPTPEQFKEWSVLNQAAQRSYDIAQAVVDFLHSYFWQATLGRALDEHGHTIRDVKIFPPDMLKIRIGLYPPVWLVGPPGVEPLKEALAKEDKQTKEMADKQEEYLLKNMSPAEVLQYKAEKARREQDEEKYSGLYAGPCKTIDEVSNFMTRRSLTQ